MKSKQPAAFALKAFTGEVIRLAAFALAAFPLAAFPLAVATVAWSFLFLPGPAAAKPWWTRGVESNEADFLDPDVAYRAAVRVDGQVLRVHWVIAQGYYLYRQKMDIKAESPDLVLGEPSFPRGTMKTDPYLGTQEIFTQEVEATVPFTRLDAGAHPIQLKVTYQGCAEAGLCYPPISKVLFAKSATAAAAPRPPAHPWEGVAILGGGFAFLFGGFLLRKDRHLDTPAA
jgi:thiol:disulfide interchange protein